MKEKNDVYAGGSGTWTYGPLNTIRDSLKSCRSILRSMVGVLILLSGIAGSPISNAAINIYFSASAPPALQTELLASLTTQYTVQVTASQYFPNTYTATVTGANPNYQCGGTVTVNVPCQLDVDVNSMVAVSTYTGVYMFGSGMKYQQDQQIDFVGGMEDLCGSATSYNLVRTTTATFNAATCQDVTGTIEDELYNEQLSTPTVIPPEDAL